MDKFINFFTTVVAVFVLTTAIVSPIFIFYYIDQSRKFNQSLIVRLQHECTFLIDSEKKK